MEKKILVLLAGRCAEQVVFSLDGITTGASGDIRRAGEIAVNLAGELGFQEHPAIHENTFLKAFGARFDPSEKARKMLSDLYEENLSFLRNNIEVLLALSNELIEKESMFKAEIDRFFRENPVHVSSESDDSTMKDAI